MPQTVARILGGFSVAVALALAVPACTRLRGGQESKTESHQEHHQIVVTTPWVKDVTISRPYVCQIRAQRCIEVRPLVEGYVEQILVREGQHVKQGEILFKILPILYQTRLDSELADVQLIQIKLDNARKLSLQQVISNQEVAMLEAELARARARAAQARAELDFTQIRAPFDGLVDRLQQQLGSLVKKEDVLTHLTDNSIMWVYFNVPERQYLEYARELQEHKEIGTIELMLANGQIFAYRGQLGAIEAKFNNETGNIPFRADFPNPQGILRHGQTGTILIHRTLKNALIIPQRATYEILEKQYVYVVDEHHVVHQREITIQHELDDIFVIEKGLTANDRIILEGVREVRDGQTIEYTHRPIEEVLAHLKYHAE
jgi:membrane fusion protein (multidrug efflux system)